MSKGRREEESLADQGVMGRGKEKEQRPRSSPSLTLDTAARLGPGPCACSPIGCRRSVAISGDVA
jgi:hypothetical protein